MTSYKVLAGKTPIASTRGLIEACGLAKATAREQPGVTTHVRREDDRGVTDEAEYQISGGKWRIWLR